MKFCKECQSLLQKTTSGSNLLYKCRCGVEISGEPVDTLMAVKMYNSSVAEASADAPIVHQSSEDPAGNKVFRDCSCGMNIMTMIILGDNMTVIYTCDCGNIEFPSGSQRDTANKKD